MTVQNKITGSKLTRPVIAPLKAAAAKPLTKTAKPVPASLVKTKVGSPSKAPVPAAVSRTIAKAPVTPTKTATSAKK